MAKKNTPPAANPFEAMAEAPSKKKGKSKVLEIQTPNLRQEIADWIEADASEKDAKARKGIAEAVFLPEAEMLRIGISQEKKEFQSSVRLSSGESAVTCTFPNKYSALDAENLPVLQKLFGDDYEKFFASTLEVTILPSADLKALADAVGQENLTKFFSVKRTVKPTEAFHEARVIDRIVAEKAAKVIDEGIVNPQKASVRAYRSGDDGE